MVKLMLVVMWQHGSDAPAYLDSKARGFRATADYERADACVRLAERVRHCHRVIAGARRA